MPTTTAHQPNRAARGNSADRCIQPSNAERVVLPAHPQQIGRLRWLLRCGHAASFAGSSPIGKASRTVSRGSPARLHPWRQPPTGRTAWRDAETEPPSWKPKCVWPVAQLIAVFRHNRHPLSVSLSGASALMAVRNPRRLRWAGWLTSSLHRDDFNRGN